MRISLATIAHGRSGDKGNHANIAVIAYTLDGFAWLRENLTAELVHKYFGNLGASRVVRFEAPNLLAVNFLLYDVLAGGASRSLRSDTQGKTYALALLEMRVEPLAHISTMVRPGSPRCEKCGSPMVLQQAPRGRFFRCSAYPHCRNVNSSGSEGEDE